MLSTAIPSKLYSQVPLHNNNIIKHIVCSICSQSHEPGLTKCPAVNIFGNAICNAVALKHNATVQKQNEQIQLMQEQLKTQQKWIEQLQQTVNKCQAQFNYKRNRSDSSASIQSNRKDDDDDEKTSVLSSDESLLECFKTKAKSSRMLRQNKNHKHVKYNNSIISLDTVEESDHVSPKMITGVPKVIAVPLTLVIPACVLLSEWLKQNRRSIWNRSLESLFAVAKQQHPEWVLRSDPNEEQLDLENTMLGQALESTNMAINIPRLRQIENERFIVGREPVLSKADMQLWLDTKYSAWLAKNSSPGRMQQQVVSTRDMLQDMQLDCRKYAPQSATYSEQHPMYIELLLENGFEMKLDQQRQPIACKNLSSPAAHPGLSILSCAAQVHWSPIWYAKAHDIQLHANQRINEGSNPAFGEARERMQQLLQQHFEDSHYQMCLEFQHIDAAITVAQFYAFIGYDQYYPDLFQPLDLSTYHVMLHTLDTIEEHVQANRFPILQHCIDIDTDDNDDIESIVSIQYN